MGVLPLLIESDFDSTEAECDGPVSARLGRDEEDGESHGGRIEEHDPSAAGSKAMPKPIDLLATTIKHRRSGLPP
jgi:hypothetical protein